MDGVRIPQTQAWCLVACMVVGSEVLGVGGGRRDARSSGGAHWFRALSWELQEGGLLGKAEGFLDSLHCRNLIQVGGGCTLLRKDKGPANLNGVAGS